LNSEHSLYDKMKKGTKKRNVSISGMTESLFKKETESDNKPFRIKTFDELPDWIRGIKISGDPVPDFDHKAGYHKYLEEKYGL